MALLQILSHGQGTHSAKMVLIVWPKIHQMPQNVSAQFVCLSPKVWDIIEKRLHRASVVRDQKDLGILLLPK